MSAELKPTPCPVCGKLPTICKGVTTWSVYHECEEIPNWYLEISDSLKTTSEAIEKWNWLMGVLGGRKAKPELDLRILDVPKDIRDSTLKIEKYFADRNVTNWELLGIRSR